MKNIIEQKRKERGMTQQQLAAALGVSRQTIISLENGKYNPSILLAHAIARLFGTQIEDIFRFEEEGVVMYSYPIGAGDRRKVIDELRTICEEEKRPLIMSPLSEADREQMLTWYSEQFLIQGDRNDYDYIYSREKLATLAGKKMHGKRNHIARFQDEDDWCYEELNDSNIEECRNMTYTWIKMRAEKWNEEMELEMSVLHEAFDHR